MRNYFETYNFLGNKQHSILKIEEQNKKGFEALKTSQTNKKQKSKILKAVIHYRKKKNSGKF